MSLISTSSGSQALFMFATILIVFWANNKIDDPLSFFISGVGIIVFSFFLRRGIHQFIGGR